MKQRTKKFILLMTCCMIFSLFAACGTGEQVAETTSIVPSEQVAETTPFVPGEPYLLENMPEVDISFIPETITVSQDVIDQYAFTPNLSDTLPVIHINTEDGSNSFATEYTLGNKLLDEIDYVNATISVENCDEAMILTDVEASVKVRGNFTLNYVKKPLRIKFDKKQNMLGLHNGEAYKNWVLLADWKDMSMQNNMMAFYLGNTILGSDGYYSTDFRNVEVYLNGEYWGVYLLVEQQEAKDSRFSVPEVEDDYEGTDIGYLVEYDGYYISEMQMPDGAGDPTFVIEQDDTLFDQPGYTVKSDINHDAQLTFLSNYIQNAYTIVYSATQEQQYLTFNEDYTELVESDFDNAQDAISSCIDIQSLVDTYILNDIACDPDLDWSSFYISLDMSETGSKKLIFEGPWDFDSAFGICPGYSKTFKTYAFNSRMPWFTLLQEEEWFLDLVAQKWDTLKQAGVLDNALALSLYHTNTYAESYARNFERWPSRLEEDISELTEQANAFTSQADAAAYQYNWLKERFTHLDSVWAPAE